MWGFMWLLDRAGDNRQSVVYWGGDMIQISWGDLTEVISMVLAAEAVMFVGWLIIRTLNRS